MSDDFLPPRVLAVDPGAKRIGLAISDPFGHFAVGLETIPAAGNPLDKLANVCREYSVAQIVIGLPLHMNGDEGESARLARDFGQQLAQVLQIPVDYLDERLTSRIAEATLREQGIQGSRKRKSGIIDQTSAMLILQDYLNRRANQSRH